MAGDFERDQSKPNFFTSRSGSIAVGDRRILVRMLKMDGSTMIFLNNCGPECVDEMAVAMPVPGKEGAISTTVLGPPLETLSKRLAEKLSKRFGRQFFVSFNFELDHANWKKLDEAIAEYINGHTEQLA